MRPQRLSKHTDSCLSCYGFPSAIVTLRKFHFTRMSTNGGVNLYGDRVKNFQPPFPSDARLQEITLCWPEMLAPYNNGATADLCQILFPFQTGRIEGIDWTDRRSGLIASGGG